MGKNEFFSIDDLKEVNGYNESTSKRKYFEKTLTFPVEKKKIITKYLKKHYKEIIDFIIKEAETDDVN